jgi:high-affinity K+ transport system ATPase subunit B
METIFRLFMYIFPYAVSTAFYVWIFRKALRVQRKPYRIAALVFVIAGLGYTLTHMVTTITKALSDDRFHFGIIIITIIVLFFASIAMAFGEPEIKEDAVKK